MSAKKTVLQNIIHYCKFKPTFFYVMYWAPWLKQCGPFRRTCAMNGPVAKLNKIFFFSIRCRWVRFAKCGCLIKNTAMYLKHICFNFLLLPTWYTNVLFIHINYIKLNSSTCFERNPLIIRRSTTQIVHMQPLVSSLSASDRLVQPLRKSFLSTRPSLAESDDTRGCICIICVVGLLMMGGLRSKHVEEFNIM